MLVVGEHLIAEFVDELIEAEIHFGFEFVVEKLLLDFGEGILGGVVVEIQRVENVLHHRGLPRFQAVVRQNPGHAHLDGKLDSPAHRHFQEELSIPAREGKRVETRFFQLVKPDLFLSQTEVIPLS